MFSHHSKQFEVFAEWVEQQLHAVEVIPFHQLLPTNIYVSRAPGAQECDPSYTRGPTTISVLTGQKLQSHPLLAVSSFTLFGGSQFFVLIIYWGKSTKERKISHIYTGGMLQGTKRFNLYWIFLLHHFNNQDLGNTTDLSALKM